MPLGGGTSATLNAYRTFVLEIHYDNPDGIPDQRDSSGVRAYYSKTKRLHEAGIFSVGDPYVVMRDQPIESGLTSYRFECVNSCSSLMLSDGQPVTVLREYLHMHQSGYAMYNEHVRDGQVIRTGALDFFEFNMNGGPAVQQDPFEIVPGDAFNVQCYYQNAASANRTFGLASSEEMCVAFLLYYPRKVLQLSEDLSLGWLCSYGYADFGFQQCDAPVSSETLADGTVPDRRTFGTAPEQCSSEAVPGPDDTDGGGGDDANSTTTAGRTSSGNIASNKFAVAVGVRQVAAWVGSVVIAMDWL
jgi:Copper type II ascorbate-dependent monooxygenase, C-terminal domain